MVNKKLVLDVIYNEIYLGLFIFFMMKFLSNMYYNINAGLCIKNILLGLGISVIILMSYYIFRKIMVFFNIMSYYKKKRG
jgi:hypothetical protein